MDHGKLQYRVQWKGWDDDKAWYNASGFKNAAGQLLEFHEKYPEKPGPPKRIQQWIQAALVEEADPDHPDNNKPLEILIKRTTKRRQIQYA